MADAALELELSLHKLAEFFHAPALDPLNGVYDERSGVERVLDELRIHPAARNVAVVVRVPAEELTDETESRARAALIQYSNARLEQQDRKLKALERRGGRALLIGVVFWGVCLMLSFLFFRMENWPEFWSHFLGEGFLIAGWVGLWYPLEVLVFERWELKRECRYYDRLKTLTLTIRPAN